MDLTGGAFARHTRARRICLPWRKNTVRLIKNISWADKPVTIFEWAAIGGVVLALFIFCARVMRRGLSTLDDVRRQHMEKIGEGKRKLEEDKKKITADEQFHLLDAAISDLIRLNPKPDLWRITRKNHIIDLSNGASHWQIELLMVERSLRSSGRVLHGKPHWLLRGADMQEHYTEIASLMASLNRHLQAREEPAPMPGHLARRLVGTRASVALRQGHNSMQKSWKE